MKLVICSLVHSPVISSPLRRKYLPRHPILEHPCLYEPTSVRISYSSAGCCHKKFGLVVEGKKYIPIVQPTRCTCYLKLFILVKRSTCF
jgi:hypothetical protein